MGNRVTIVDYGMGNLDSVRRAVEECGGAPTVTDDARELASADHLVLPGVGAFGDAMANLRRRHLDVALSDVVRGDGVPLLGICLGMQLLATSGFEGGETEGLGWLEGAVRRLVPRGEDRRVPHVGWNEAVPTRDSRLFAGIEGPTDFYFVHGFHLEAEAEDVAAVTPYCGGFVSAVERAPVFAVQFHPEKSQRAGFGVLRNFLEV